MPITVSRRYNSNGINYTYEADGPADHALIPNSTYFKDLTDSLLYYKNPSGVVLNLFSEEAAATSENSIHVMVSGSDATGTRNDMNKPFQTLVAAVAASVAGDLIVVHPGAYSVAANLNASNVNFYFHPGTTITQTAGTDMFDVGAGIGGNVYGHGDFVSGGAYIYGKNTDRDLVFEANTVTGLFARANTASASAVTTIRIAKSMISGSFLIFNNGVASNWDITCPYISGASNGNPVIYTRGGRTKLTCEYLICTGTAYAYDNATGTHNHITANSATSIYVAGNCVINTSIVGLILCSGVVKFTGHCTRLYHIVGSFIGGTVSYIDRYTPTSGLGTGMINTTLDTTTNTCDLSSTPTATDTLQLELRMLNGAAFKTFNCGNGVKLHLAGTWASHFNVFNMSGTSEVHIDGRYISYDALGNIPFVLTGTSKLILEGRIEMDRSIPAISMVAGTKLIFNGGVITTNDNLTVPIKAIGAAQNYKVLAGGFSTNYTGHSLSSAVLERRQYNVTAANVTTSLNVYDGTIAPNFEANNPPIVQTKAQLAAALVALINANVPLGVTASQDTPGVDEYFYIEADTAANAASGSTLVNLTETILVTTSSYALTDTVGGLLIQDTDVE